MEYRKAVNTMRAPRERGARRYVIHATANAAAATSANAHGDRGLAKVTLLFQLGEGFVVSRDGLAVCVGDSFAAAGRHSIRGGAAIQASRD